jgi:enoyl-CoA hydratase/carnithine racemase
VATLTLDRPAQLNAINMAMRDLLWVYFEAVEAMPDVRALVFRGEGRAFSAGADISEFGTAPGIMAARRARHDRDLWWLLLNLRVPTIARMHGFCFGAGLELPLCCDLRIAEEGTRFALPEVTLGYIPSACGTQTLPRIVAPGVAAHMILTGDAIDTPKASRWGLVHKVAPAGGLDAALEEQVAEALANPADVMRRRREMVSSGVR